MSDLLLMEKRARDYAIIVHTDQKYGYDKPYVYHLDMVNEVAREFNLSMNIRIAAYLHDVIEDTPVDFNALCKDWGADITCMVDGVSEPNISNRLERHERTYLKTRANADAIRLKLCDRIANVRAALEPGGDMSHHEKYKHEYDHFEKWLKIPGMEVAMWGHLRRLML